MPQTLHPVIERHYTVAELARLWQLDQSTVRRVFQDEPGVLKLGRGTRGKRAYVTLRIPESVAERVHRERSR
jgi:transposase-like protein